MHQPMLGGTSLRLSQLLVLWIASSAALYIHTVEFEDTCKNSRVALASAVQTDVCLAFPEGGFFMHKYLPETNQATMTSYSDSNCQFADASPEVFNFYSNCIEDYQYFFVGVSDSPTPDHGMLASYGGGAYCVVERTTGCGTATAGYEYILEGACVYDGGQTSITTCTNSAMTLNTFAVPDAETCEEKNRLNTTTQSKGTCIAFPSFWIVYGATGQAAFVEKVTVGAATSDVSLGEEVASAISALAAVAIAGSAAGAASSSVAGSVGGSGGGGGGATGAGGGAGGASSGSVSSNLTSIWLLLFQIQFLSLISTMGSATMKAFGSSLNWANLYSAIQGVTSDCDSDDADEEATGGILAFFLLFIPLVIAHIMFLASLQAYVKVKALNIKLHTPRILQFPRIELRLLLVALAGQTYAYSRLAACGKNGGTAFAGVVLLLLLPIPLLALIFHIVMKLNLSDGLVSYEDDDAMKFGSVKASVTPVGQRMWENIKQLQSPETDICRGDWASIKEDADLKDDFLGRFGVIFEDYTRAGAKYAFVVALCTVATSFFLATADSEAASVLVFFIYLAQYLILVFWSPFNNAVINAQEIAGGFFNVITLMIVMAGVYQDSDELFEDAMYLQIFVILIKGFPGIIAAAQALVQLCLFSYRFWKLRQAAKEAEAADQPKSDQPEEGKDSAQPDSESPVADAAASQDPGTKSAPVSRSSSTAVDDEKLDDSESQAKVQPAEGGSTAEAVMNVMSQDMEDGEAVAVESLFELYRLSRQIAKSTKEQGGSTRLSIEERQQFKKEFFDLTKQFTTRTVTETNSAARESVRRSASMKDAVGRVSLQLRASAAARFSVSSPNPSSQVTPANDDVKAGSPAGAANQDVEDFGFDAIHPSEEAVESFGSPDKL